jgi:hypothetical protein
MSMSTVACQCHRSIYSRRNRWVLILVIIGGAYLLAVAARGFCCCLTDRCRLSSNKVAPATAARSTSASLSSSHPVALVAFGTKSHSMGGFHSLLDLTAAVELPQLRHHSHTNSRYDNGNDGSLATVL